MDIVVTGLRKTYGPQVAVDSIDLRVHAGEVLGFLGPNGAGKSTTMKMICGLLSPDAGQVSLGGQQMGSDALELRRRIGYLPENNPLYEEMPVIDLLRFTARLQGVPEGQLSERISAMVAACGLDAEKHKRVGELSKGYRQRVGLAQAMVHDPDVLILDEPTTGLDPNQIVEIRQLIKELGRAKTVIFSTHILPEVEATCDRIMIIDKGRIVANGRPDELRLQAQGRQVLLARIEDGPAGAVREALSTLPGIEEVLSDSDGYALRCAPGAKPQRAIFQLCAGRGWPLTELRVLETRLEDIFRELTLN